MLRVLATVALILLAAAPMGHAHVPPGPNFLCEPFQAVHDYGPAPWAAPGVSGSSTFDSDRSRWALLSDPYQGDVQAAVDTDPPGVDAELREAPQTNTGLVKVTDGNLDDCDFDGIPLDFDGDYEYGQYGGFFPAGPWAADPLCDYGLTWHHGPNFAVIDEILPPPHPWFLVGADEAYGGPTLIPNSGDPDGWDCFTDGVIAPQVNPADCLEVFLGNGVTSCPPGADGGWWVHVSPAVVQYEEGPSVIVWSATAGHIVAW